MQQIILVLEIKRHVCSMYVHIYIYMEQLHTLFSIITYETLFSLGIRVKAGLSACSRANFVYCGIESELTLIFVTLPLTGADPQRVNCKLTLTRKFVNHVRESRRYAFAERVREVAYKKDLYPLFSHIAAQYASTLWWMGIDLCAAMNPPKIHLVPLR